MNKDKESPRCKRCGAEFKKGEHELNRDSVMLFCLNNHAEIISSHEYEEKYKRAE